MELSELIDDGWITLSEAARILDMPRVRSEEVLRKNRVRSKEYRTGGVRPRWMYWRAEVEFCSKREHTVPPSIQAPALIDAGPVLQAVHDLRDEIRDRDGRMLTRKDLDLHRQDMCASFRHVTDSIVKLAEAIQKGDTAAIESTLNNLHVSDEGGRAWNLFEEESS